MLSTQKHGVNFTVQTAHCPQRQNLRTASSDHIHTKRTENPETYLYDGRGSVVQLLQGGTVSQSYSYNAYGYINTDEYGIQTPFYGYNGEQHDPATGLQYLRARYYAPQNGGFISQDSFAGLLTDALSQNRYTYTENDPVNYIDPTGHAMVAVSLPDGGGSSGGGKSTTSAVTKNTQSSQAKKTVTATPTASTLSSTSTYTSGVTKAAQKAKTGSTVATSIAAIASVSLNSYTSLTKAIEAMKQYSRATCNSKTLKYRSIDEPIDVYYGNIWGENEAKDMNYADKSGDELLRIHYYIARNYTAQDEKSHLDTLRNLAQLTSKNDLEMRNVLNEMINHFADETGTEYSNPILTQRVAEHPRTQDYMHDFTEQFKKMISQTNGDIESFADGREFHNLLQNNGIFFSKYSYGGDLFDEDTFSGLTMAVHGWTESTVKLVDYKQIGNKYYGTLQFVFSDNFGLDVIDVVKYGYFDGFADWYVLQHYDGYDDRYRPFKTIVSLEYSFEGVIG